MPSPQLHLHRATVHVHPDSQRPGDTEMVVYAELLAHHHAAAVQLQAALAMAWSLRTEHVLITQLATERQLLTMSTLEPSAGDARLLQLGRDHLGEPVWADPDRTMLMVRGPWLRRLSDAQRATQIWQRLHTHLHAAPRALVERRRAC
jgi:hypothetical protein